MITTEIIKITDMHCASCAVNIEKQVSKLKGVEEISLNFLPYSLHILILYKFLAN